MTKEQPNWDYKDRLYLSPCKCHHDCGNYVLMMKGDMTHVRNAPEDQFIDIASLSVDEMFDLHANLTEKLDIECKRMDLEETIER